MKKLKLTALAFVFLLSSCMFFALPANAATTPSQSAAVSWANSQLGKTVGEGSCVYLIYSYYSYLGRSVNGLNANEFIDDPIAVPSGWTRLSSNFVPQPGDIAVWTPGLGGSNPTYGHVGIVINGNSSNFTVVDQNAPNPVCTTNTYPTGALACVIRPNFGEEIVPVSWATDTSRQSIGTTNATLAIKGSLYGLTNTSVTKAGVYLYDYAGKQIGSKTESFTAHSGDTYFLAWYNINTELAVTLSPGTKYKYKFMAVISGKTYYSSMMSFTTGGTHSHSYWTETVTKEPTCTATGTKTKVCKTCGYVSTTTLAKLSHTYSSTWTVDKAATCTAEGSKSRHCTLCTAKTDVTAIAKLAHSYGEWTVVNAATCTSTGTKQRTCSCGAYETATIAKTAHTYSSNWTVDKAATCTAEGSKSRHCTLCTAKTDVTAIAKLAHSYGEWTVVNAATCTSTGTKQRTCSCGAYETATIAKTAHTYSSNWTVDKAATCTAEGSKSRHCTLCTAKTDVTAIPKIAHSYGEWKTVTAATCTVAGTKKRTCSCGAYETATIAKAAHTYSSSWTVDKAATCTAEGSKSHHCTLCTAKTDVTAIPKIAHSYGEWSVKTEATVEKDGTEIRKCVNSGCSYTETRIIPKLPVENHVHSFGEWQQTLSPTCTEDGSMSRFCDCSAEQIQIIPATDHIYGDWIQTSTPTTDKEGTEQRLCKNCPHKEERTVAKLPVESAVDAPTISDINSEVSSDTQSTQQPQSSTASKIDGTISENKGENDNNYVMIAIIAVSCALIGAAVGCGLILVLKKR